MAKITIGMDVLKEVMDSILSTADAERKKADSYKDMFKVSNSFSGLLRELDFQTKGATLDACSILEEKYGVYISNDIYAFLLAIPYLAKKLETHIEKEDGHVYCTDKTFYLLSEELKRLINEND